MQANISMANYEIEPSTEILKPEDKLMSVVMKSGAEVSGIIDEKLKNEKM